jgi:hypothetical protein
MKAVRLIPILLLVLANRCMAFDVWGFTSGEDRAAVERAAKEHGDELRQIEGLTVVNRRSPDTGAFETYHLRYCNDRLGGVTKVESFTPAGAVNELSDLIGRYGAPQVSADENTIHSFTDFVVKEVKYAWRPKNDEVLLTMNLPAAQGLKLEPGMTLIYGDTAVCGSAAPAQSAPHD